MTIDWWALNNYCEHFSCPQTRSKKTKSKNIYCEHLSFAYSCFQEAFCSCHRRWEDEVGWFRIDQFNRRFLPGHDSYLKIEKGRQKMSNLFEFYFRLLTPRVFSEAKKNTLIWRFRIFFCILTSGNWHVIGFSESCRRYSLSLHYDFGLADQLSDNKYI